MPFSFPLSHFPLLPSYCTSTFNNPLARPTLQCSPKARSGFHHSRVREVRNSNRLSPHFGTPVQSRSREKMTLFQVNPMHGHSVQVLLTLLRRRPPAASSRMVISRQSTNQARPGVAVVHLHLTTRVSLCAIIRSSPDSANDMTVRSLAMPTPPFFPQPEALPDDYHTKSGTWNYQTSPASWTRFHQARNKFVPHKDLVLLEANS